MRRGLPIGRICAYHPPDQARPGMSALQRRKEGQRPTRASARPSDGSPRDGPPPGQQSTTRHRSGVPMPDLMRRQGRSRRPAVEALRRYGRLREVSMTQARQEAISQDTRDLHKLGYAQELYRSMGGFSNFAISFSIISILTGAVTLYGYGLEMGGPLEMSLGWPLATLFTLTVAASMAELCSAYPTSGAMYHWAADLGGPGAGWFVAWLNIFGLIAAQAGINYSCAQFILPFLGLASKPRNLLLMFAFILITQGVLNHYGVKLVAILNDLSVSVHIAGVAILVAGLLFLAPKQPVGFLFEAVNSNGRSFYWWAFVLGLL